MSEMPEDELAVKIRTIFDELHSQYSRGCTQSGWDQGSYSPENDLALKIRTIFDELDPQCMAILRRLSPARRIEMSFEMHRMAHQIVTASVLSRYPDISEVELHSRVRERIIGTYGTE